MQSLVATVLVLAALVIGQWPLLRDIHGAWMDKYGAYSHGYLGLALAVVLAVRHWRRSPVLATTPCWKALPVFVLLLGASIVLDRLFVGGFRSLLLPPLLLSAVAVGVGLPAARLLLGPAAFLFLVLPIWSPVNGALQELTTRVAGVVLQLLGVPVFLEGNFVHLPSGSFEIAAGCSGLNYFLAALMMGAVACAFLVEGWKRRLTIMAAASVLGMFANWVRVVSLVVIGHRTEMQSYLIRVDHLWFGWVIFLVAMVPVVLLARWYSAPPARSPADQAPPEQEGAANAAPGGAAATLVACMLLLVPVIVPGWSAAAPAASQVESVAFPSGWSPAFVGASISRNLENEPDGTAVESVRARYDRQRPDARISEFRNSTRGSGWSAVESRRLDLPAGRGVVTEHRGAVEGREGLIWDWVVVAGRPVASSKLDYRLRELASLLSGRRDAEIIAIHSNCNGNCETARAAMGRVANRLLNADDLSTASQFPEP